MSSSFTKLKVGFTTILAIIILFGGFLWVKNYNPVKKKIKMTATILFFVAFAISKIVKESPTEEIPTAINNMSMQSASQQFDKPNFPE